MLVPLLVQLPLQCNDCMLVSIDSMLLEAILNRLGGHLVDTFVDTCAVFLEAILSRLGGHIDAQHPLKLRL